MMVSFFKDDQGRVRKIDSDDKVSSNDLNIDEAQGKVAKSLVNQAKANDIKTLKQVNMESKEFKLDDAVIMKLKALEGDDVDVESVEDGASSFGNGDLITLDNGSQYISFEDSQAMEREAQDQIRQDLEEDEIPFNADFLERHQSVNDTNARLLAQDFASSELSGYEDGLAEEVEDQVRDDLQDKEDDDDFDDLVGTEVQKRLPKALEEKELELTEVIQGKIKDDFRHFIVHDEGLVSEEDFQKQYGKWMHLNIDEAIEDAISSDGAEHFISHIDGESHEVGNDNDNVLVKSNG